MIGSLPPPMNLPPQALDVPLVGAGKFMWGRAGVGGRTETEPHARIAPHPIPPPQTNRSKILRKSSRLQRLVWGEGTNPKGNAQHQNWRVRL